MRDDWAWRNWQKSPAWLSLLITTSARSPHESLQYQKQIRLQAARARMLADDVDAASVAFEVGYESASQFNREYSRLFGQHRSVTSGLYVRRVLPDSNSPPRPDPISHSFCLSVLGETVACIYRPRVVAKGRATQTRPFRSTGSLRLARPPLNRHICHEFLSFRHTMQKLNMDRRKMRGNPVGRGASSSPMSAHNGCSAILHYHI